MDTTITVFTIVTGNPTPNSTWTRDGVPLTSGRTYNTDNTGVLVISNVLLSDTGNYTNTLQNMFNNESFTNNFIPFHCKYSVKMSRWMPEIKCCFLANSLL